MKQKRKKYPRPQSQYLQCYWHFLKFGLNQDPLHLPTVSYTKGRVSVFSILPYFILLLFICWVVSDSVTPWTAAHQASLPFTISWNLLKLMSIESMMPSNRLILFLLSPLALNLAWGQGVFHWVGSSHQGGQSIGAPASVSVLPANIQGRFPLGWTSWMSLQSKGLSRVLSSTTVQQHQFFGAQPSLWSKSYSTQMPRVCTSNWHAVPPGQTRRSAGGGYIRGGCCISTYTARAPVSWGEVYSASCRMSPVTYCRNDQGNRKAFMLSLPSQYAASGQGSGPLSFNRTG